MKRLADGKQAKGCLRAMWPEVGPWFPERRGVEVKERVHHGWGMGEATSGSEVLRKDEGALGFWKWIRDQIRLVPAEAQRKTVAGTRRLAREICYFG